MSVTACSSVRIGGQTVEDEFTDPNVVQLVHAAIKGDADKVVELAAAGADVNAQGKKGSSPLFWAIYVTNIAGVEALLKAGANPNQYSPDLGSSPMGLLSGGNTPELLALVLRYGGDPNTPESGKIEDRPLSKAASQGHLENIQMLLKAGAEINAHDDYDHSAATYAGAMGNFEIVAYLLNQGYSYNLSDLAKGVEIRQVSSDREPWKNKVIDILKAKGVELPVIVHCYQPNDPRHVQNSEECKKGGKLNP